MTNEEISAEYERARVEAVNQRQENGSDGAPSGWICLDCGTPLSGPDDDHECRFDA